jgi:hypothetical protein
MRFFFTSYIWYIKSWYSLSCGSYVTESENGAEKSSHRFTFDGGRSAVFRTTLTPLLGAFSLHMGNPFTFWHLSDATRVSQKFGMTHHEASRAIAYGVREARRTFPTPPAAPAGSGRDSCMSPEGYRRHARSSSTSAGHHRPRV